MKLKRTDNSNTDFQNLITLLDGELHGHYGEVKSEYDRYNQISNLNTVVIAYRDQNPAGCGCFKKINDTTVEIKRMFVKPNARGQGIASAILNELELWAKEDGFSHVILETGNKQLAAITLYQKSGYVIIPNYGQYSGMESSICMKKEL
jgi:putative acetyltransferase